MSTKNHRTHKLLWLLVAIVIIGLILGWYFGYHRKSTNTDLTTPISKIKGTKSTPEAPQPATDSATNDSGGVSSQAATTTTLPPSSDWISSSNDAITVQEPSSNSVFASGDNIVGLAKVKTVQFILTDSSVGLIAQGNLNVVNGKFSGTIQFTPHSSSGKLEVYYPNPSNGAEEDVVDVNVSFNN